MLTAYVVFQHWSILQLRHCSSRFVIRADLSISGTNAVSLLNPPNTSPFALNKIAICHKVLRFVKSIILSIHEIFRYLRYRIRESTGRISTEDIMEKAMMPEIYPGRQMKENELTFIMPNSRQSGLLCIFGSLWYRKYPTFSNESIKSSTVVGQPWTSTRIWCSMGMPSPSQSW